MAEVTLEVTRRERSGKEYAKKLRQDGKIPAVVYGGHKEPVAITVERKAVSDLIQKSDHGIRSIFLLKMSGTDQQRHAMIKDMQMDPISRRMTHIDFVRVVMDEVVRVTVPVQHHRQLDRRERGRHPRLADPRASCRVSPERHPRQDRRRHHATSAHTSRFASPTCSFPRA